MGAKAIEITYGTADTYLQKGDTLRSSRDRDLMDMAGSELDFFKQKVSQLTTDLSRTLDNLNRPDGDQRGQHRRDARQPELRDGRHGRDTLGGEKQPESALDDLSKFSDMLGENARRVDSIIGDVIVSPRSSPRTVRPQAFAGRGALDGLVARIARAKARSASSSALPNCTIRSTRPATTSPRCWPMSNSIPAVTSTSRSSGATREDEGASRQEGRRRLHANG